MKDFFNKKPYEYMDKDAELTYIILCDNRGVLKEY
jgi:hypothetical protein